jgi:hypothetical protein
MVGLYAEKLNKYPAASIAGKYILFLWVAACQPALIEQNIANAN